MKYRYTLDGKPLLDCPECDADLTAPGGIDLQLSISGVTASVPSSLDDEGFLLDTEDNAVDNGYHSATCCGGCGDMLVDMEGIVED